MGRLGKDHGDLEWKLSSRKWLVLFGIGAMLNFMGQKRKFQGVLVL